jgi:hypothetical protein
LYCIKRPPKHSVIVRAGKQEIHIREKRLRVREGRNIAVVGQGIAI